MQARLTAQQRVAADGPGGYGPGDPAERHRRWADGTRTRLLTEYIHKSILRIVAERAKIFRNGGSQAVRLPKSCRFDDEQTDVIVRRVGRQVILEPADEWPPEFLACLGAWNEDIPRPTQTIVGSKKDPFAKQ